METRETSLDELTEDPSNARRHGPRNLKSILASLKMHGQVEPLVVQKKSGRVIGGNGRLAVMRELGWTHAHVVELDVDDTQATALAITLNRTAELAEWDNDVLGDLLRSMDVELLETTGFDEVDVRSLGSWDLKPEDVSAIDDYDEDKDTFIAKIEGIKSADRELVERVVNEALGPLGLGLTCKVY